MRRGSKVKLKPQFKLIMKMIGDKSWDEQVIDERLLDGVYFYSRKLKKEEQITQCKGKNCISDQVPYCWISEFDTAIEACVSVPICALEKIK